jgi:hypothetical protein
MGSICTQKKQPRSQHKLQQEVKSAFNHMFSFNTQFYPSKMHGSHSNLKPNRAYIDITVFRNKIAQSANKPIWLTSIQGTKCRAHYIQYNCPHREPMVWTPGKNCRACAHSPAGKCDPVVLEVLSPEWCPDCWEDNERSRLVRKGVENWE